MTTLKTISAALKLIDTKKESLKKAYDDLHSHSSLLSSFSLSWSQLDSHFTSIQNSLTHRFTLLESLESQQPLQLISSEAQNPNDLALTVTVSPNDQSSPSSSSSDSADQNLKLPIDPSSSTPPTQNGKSAAPKNYMVGTVKPRYELSVLCEKMDGKGLRKYVVENLKDKYAIQDELPGALRCASDPAAMVLESLDGFHGVNVLRDNELRKLRKGCMLLLDQLRVLSPKIGFKVREQAKKLAVEWKERLMNDSTAKTLEALGFLHLVAAYGLVSEFSMDELVDSSSMAAINDEVPELCRSIGLTDKIPDLVQKLVEKGKHVLAVKYVYEFDLADKIPPVPILKAGVEEAKKLAKRLSQEGKSLNEITARETHALKSVIKVIENNELESEYPPSILEERIELLKKQKNNRKHTASAFSAKPQPQQQQQQPKKKRQRLKQKQPQQSGNKHPRISAPVGPAVVPKNVGIANSASHQYQQPYVPPTGLLPEQLNPYMSSQAMPYGMVGPTPTISPYTGPLAGSYGFSGVPMGSSGNPSQGGLHPYTSEPNLQSGYYDRTTAHSGYGLQQYYQHYYPQ